VAELDHERVERNYFQLERDKINTFWEITKKELEDRKAELRNKDREAEELEERHQVEIKVYKQKVKHLLYEHQNNGTFARARPALRAQSGARARARAGRRGLGAGRPPRGPGCARTRAAWFSSADAAATWRRWSEVGQAAWPAVRSTARITAEDAARLLVGLNGSRGRGRRGRAAAARLGSSSRLGLRQGTVRVPHRARGLRTYSPSSLRARLVIPLLARPSASSLVARALSVATLKSEGEVALKLQHDEHSVREAELKKDKRSLKLELKELELAHEDVIRELKHEHDKNTTKLRQEYERAVKELQLKAEKKLKLLRDELELRRKVEILEVQERKNAHINELMRKHERAFGEIKNYYNDITHNNLDLIRSLKEEVADMNKKLAANEKLMFEIAQENKKLSEPLTRALKEVRARPGERARADASARARAAPARLSARARSLVAHSTRRSAAARRPPAAQVEKLRHELANYQKDKMSLQNAKSRLHVLETQLRDLSWEHEVLEQRFGAVEKERDELYDHFESTIYEVQQKSGFKNLLLEKKLDAQAESLEKKEAQLGEVLAAANLDPTMLGAVTRKLDDVLDSKNSALKGLQYELDRVTKAHNDVIRVYESKLTEFGIPVEELGFRPLVTSTGTGPAGLVAA
jgi:hypothetical protein